MVAAVTLYPLGRRTSVGITYAGRDVSADLGPYLTRLEWSDALSGEADDLQIGLQDRAGLWATDWRPEFGDVVEASLEAESWVNGGEVRRLVFGRNIVDEMENQGPPATCTLKAVSAGLSTGLRRTKRTRAWAGTKLRDIAQDIADRAELTLLWSAPDFEFKRQDQKNESDLAFLLRLCEDSGLCCKVTDGQLAVFADTTLEAGDPVVTLYPGLAQVLSWSLRDSTADRYVSAVVRYRDPGTGRVVEGIAGETHRENGKTVAQEPCLRETRYVDDLAQAQRLAAQLLAASHRGATKADFEVVGDPALVSGVVVEVDGFYGMGGNYLVTESRHQAVGGYRTALTLRRCLEAA